MKTIAILLLLPQLALAQAVIPPSTSLSGVVLTTGAQTIAGDKVFSGTTQATGAMITSSTLYAQGVIDLQSQTINNSTGTIPLTLTNYMPDSANFAAVRSNTGVAQTVAGSLIHDFANGGVRKASIDKDGGGTFGGDVKTSGSFTFAASAAFAVGTSGSNLVISSPSAGGVKLSSGQSGQTYFIADTDGARIPPTPNALLTCATGLEGRITVLAGGGAVRTKACMCTTADGSTFAWQNLATAALGNTTTCG